MPESDEQSSKFDAARRVQIRIETLMRGEFGKRRGGQIKFTSNGSARI